MLKRNDKGQYLKISPEERFWEKVEKTESCWNWIGSRNADGYGVLDIDGLNYRAHRFVLEIEGGKIPSSIKVCHKCDNPICVNPDHLFLGSQADNVKDMRDKGRASDYFTKKGHEHPKAKFTEDEIRTIKQLAGEGISQRKIAERYGVAQQTISRIINGRRYRG